MLAKFRQKILSLQSLVVVIFFISLIMVQMEGLAVDPGLGWHLGTGKYILLNTEIPRLDPFLAGSKPWIADQWLADIFLYKLYSLGSWPLLYIVYTLIFIATYCAILYPSLARRGPSFLLASLAVLIAFKLGQTHFLLRPVMLGFPLFAFLYVRLWKFYDSCIKAASGDLLPSLKIDFIALPILFLLWANIHPSFVIGLFLMGLLLVSLLLDSLLLKRIDVTLLRKFFSSFFLLSVVCLLATLVNPYGFRLHESIIWLSQSKFAMGFYDEWHSPDFRSFEGYLLEFPLMAIALALLISRGKKLGWGFFHLLTLLFFTHFAFQSVRMITYFGIVVSVPFIEAVASLSSFFRERSTSFAKSLSTAWSNLERKEARSGLGLPVLLLISGALFFHTVLSDQVFLFSGQFGPDREIYPYQALDRLSELSQKQHSVVVNEMSWGGFIPFFGRSNLKPIIDDRTAMLGDQFYYRYFDNMQPAADWKSYLQENEADYLLIKSDSNLSKLIEQNNELELLYRDDLASLFAVDFAKEDE